MVLQPTTIRLDNHRVIATKNSKLAVFGIEMNGRRLRDLARAALTPTPSKSDGGDVSDVVCQKLVIPACVIEYALPEDVRRFTHGSTQVRGISIADDLLMS
jgi:hypothetical protein